MYFLYLVTALAVLVSLSASRAKTWQAFKIAGKKFANILPAILSMLIFVSFILFLLPSELILNFLGGNSKFSGVLVAAFLGSITFMPGFIAFPLSGILLDKGVPYMVLSAFTTTLMMVGVLTYPVEKEYFGTKVTIIRNVSGFFMALIVALATGLFFGEILQ